MITNRDLFLRDQSLACSDHMDHKTTLTGQPGIRSYTNFPLMAKTLGMYKRIGQDQSMSKSCPHSTIRKVRIDIRAKNCLINQNKSLKLNRLSTDQILKKYSYRRTRPLLEIRCRSPKSCQRLRSTKLQKTIVKTKWAL